MQTQAISTPVAAPARWGGMILSGLAVLFLILDGVIKVIELPPAMESTTQLGYPAGLVFWIGLLELAALVVYVVPWTSVLGAILLTGYLGGAVATHARVGSPIFSLVFPILIGLLLWGGLYLLDGRLRALVPLRR